MHFYFDNILNNVELDFNTCYICQLNNTDGLDHELCKFICRLKWDSTNFVEQIEWYTYDNEKVKQ